MQFMHNLSTHDSYSTVQSQSQKKKKNCKDTDMTGLLSFLCPLFILLGYRLVNLHACPLPPNTQCGDCEVLQYIDGLESGELDINLTVALSLDQSRNTPDTFRQHINSDDNNMDFAFDSFSPSANLADCSREGSPCTLGFRMGGARMPACTWNYTCNYSPNRFPQYIWRAECAPGAHQIIYPIPVLTKNVETAEDCLPFVGAQAVYTWSLEEVPVACSCV